MHPPVDDGAALRAWVKVQPREELERLLVEALSKEDDDMMTG